MSCSKLSFDEMIRFTSRTNGRDKVYRTLQYASRFLAWYNFRKANVPPREFFQNVESLMSLTRKGKTKESFSISIERIVDFSLGMRLGRFVDFSKVLLESFHIRNKRLGTIFGLIAVCQGLFMLFDNLLLLNRFKIIRLAHPDNIQRYLYQVWLLWLSLALTRDYYEMQASFAVGQHQRQTDERTLVRHANIFWANKPLVIDTVKNLCDLYLPLSNLNIVRINPALQGLSGTISSVLGLLQLWDKSYQLP